MTLCVWDKMVEIFVQFCDCCTFYMIWCILTFLYCTHFFFVLVLYKFNNLIQLRDYKRVTLFEKIHQLCQLYSMSNRRRDRDDYQKDRPWTVHAQDLTQKNCTVQITSCTSFLTTCVGSTKICSKITRCANKVTRCARCTKPLPRSCLTVLAIYVCLCVRERFVD